ncbi:hypothetical protein EfmAA242_12290 [Enterococcus faecium]|nr:hypothetical protein EfmAA242_12290 [Enterococcus faecium]
MKTRSDVSSNKTKKTNYWKFAFLILLGVVLGSTVFLGSRIFANREPELPEIPALTERQGDPVLTINSNKEKVNQIISFFLSEYQKDGISTLDNLVKGGRISHGTFEVLGFPIDFYLYFDPYVMENGNVQLKARSLSIGTLSLPIKDVMNMIKRNYKLPDWIEVNTDDLTIMLRLDQFRMQNGMYIKADKIDLVNDDIRFSLYLPKDTSDASNNSNTNKTSTSSTESKTKENKKSSDE